MRLFLSIAFCLAGVAFLVAALLPLLRSRAMRAWRRAEGTIVSWEITWRDVVGVAGDAADVVRMGQVAVAYDYLVDGATRRGTRIRGWDPKLLPAKTCEALTLRYAPGAKVDVFHDPADPARAVLDRSSGFGFVGIVFLLLGAALLFGGVMLAVLP